MRLAEPISCVVAGSFNRYKAEIGPVLRGASYVPLGQPRHGYGDHEPMVWPLSNEVGLPIRQVENRFMRAIGRAGLMYIVTGRSGYVGPTVMMEVGVALAEGTYLFADAQLAMEDDGHPYLTPNYIRSNVIVAGVPETVGIYQDVLHFSK